MPVWNPIFHDVSITGNTSGATSLVSSGTLTFAGGNNITLSQAGNAITISGPTQTAPSNVVNSLNGSSGQLSLVAGTGIGFASNASTITISSTGSVVSSIGPVGSLSSGPITISGVNITVSSNGAGVIQLSAGAGGAAGTNTFSASGTSVAGTALSLALAAGPNISLQTATAASSMTVSVSGLNALSANGFASSTGTMVLSAGNNITLSTGASSIQIQGVAASATSASILASKISLTQNFSFNEVNTVVTNGSWTAGTTNTAFGSTLFLQRMFIPAGMVQTEVDVAHQISFGNSSLSGAGSMSQSFAIFSLVNSTSLSTVFSASSSWAWVSGSSSANLTGVQNGWTGPLVHTMGLTSGTAGSTSITAGDYVIGNLINVSASATVAGSSAGGSNMSMSLYGVYPITSITSATLSGLSNAGLAAVSALTASTSTAVTVWTVAPSIASVLTSGGLSAASGVSGVSSYGSAFIAGSTSGSVTGATSAHIGQVSIGAASSASSSAVITVSGTAKSTGDWGIIFLSNNSNIVSSLGVVAGSVITGSTSVSVLSNAGTLGVNLLSSGGLSAGSFIGTLNTLSAVTNVGTQALPTFSIQNTGSSFTSASPSYFSCGQMATAGIPANITLSSTNVTMLGSQALLQPWFALIGS